MLVSLVGILKYIREEDFSVLNELSLITHARSPTPTTPCRRTNIRIRDQKHEIPRQTFAFSFI